MLIKDDTPFRQWHTTKAFYHNGQMIPIDYDRKLPSDTVTFQELGSGVRSKNGKAIEEHIDNFVGTGADLDEYYSSQVR
jgi:hypothetical protein